MKPIRIQRRRVKGWRIPGNTRCVSRGPGQKFANPCRVGMFKGYTAADAVRDFRLWINRDLSVRSFENCFGKPPSIEEIKRELRGWNLACWCPLDEPCHADVLLEVANS